MTEPPGDGQPDGLEGLGAFIRRRRQLANLSLRQLAELTRISNPYLSQIERGLHQPSVRVLRLLSDALNVSAETLLAQAGILRQEGPDRDGSGGEPGGVEAAVLAEARLSDEQKNALIAVFRSMLRAD